MILGWIPIIGPIVDGIFGVWKKSQDLKIVKEKNASKERVAEIEASTRILETFKDQIDIRICRDIILFPSCVWTALVIWDKIVAIPHPELIWGVRDFNGSLELLPLAILTFLFGNAWLSRKT